MGRGLPAADEARAAAPGRPIEEIVPDDQRKWFDMHEVIDGLVDEGSFFEIKPLFARELIIGFARLDGRVVGIVANQPKVKGGVLFVDSADKARPLHLALRRLQHPAALPRRRARAS